MTLFQPQSTTKGKMLPYFYCVPYTSIFFIVVLPFGRLSCRSSVNNMETDRHTDDPETPKFLTYSQFLSLPLPFPLWEQTLARVALLHSPR